MIRTNNYGMNIFFLRQFLLVDLTLNFSILTSIDTTKTNMVAATPSTSKDSIEKSRKIG
jgi:hypothetical protein